MRTSRKWLVVPVVVLGIVVGIGFGFPDLASRVVYTVQSVQAASAAERLRFGS